MNRLEELLEVLRNADDSELACVAAKSISEEAVPAWITRLKEILIDGEDFYVREAVADPVARLMGISALPVLLDAKKIGEAEHHDNDSLVAIICDLVEEFPVEAFNVLAGLAKSDDPADRENAAWLFDFVREDRSVAILKDLLRDRDSSVVAAAIRSLGGIGGSEAISAVRGLPFLTRFKHRQVIRSAITESK